MQLFIKHIEILKQACWNHACEIKKIDTLFQKHERIEGSSVEEQLKTADTAVKEESYLAFEDFVKVDMRVGTIKECEAVAGSDKLLKLQVDFGLLGMRQILSGVQKYYTPGELIGAQGVFVVNLKPRKMMGMDSCGMMLAVSDAHGLQRLIPAKDVQAGTKVS